MVCLRLLLGFLILVQCSKVFLILCFKGDFFGWLVWFFLVWFMIDRMRKLVGVAGWGAVRVIVSDLGFSGFFFCLIREVWKGWGGLVCLVFNFYYLLLRVFSISLLGLSFFVNSFFIFLFVLSLYSFDIYGCLQLVFCFLQQIVLVFVFLCIFR